MKLPNRENAVIAPDKLTDYLLNVEHKRGGAKARLLVQFGWQIDDGTDFPRLITLFPD